MLRVNIITLFPQLVEPFLQCLPLKRAIEKNSLEVRLWQLRDFAIDKHGTVDDKPYGGGTGMILMIEPIHKALKKIQEEQGQNHKTILLSPRGEKYTQQKAVELAGCEQITLICGRYEGIDARVENYATDIVSIGDYVLSGGELPALVMLESIVRLLPGTLEKESALTEESFNENSLEYPQYTRPETYEGTAVPDILLSGNHKEIEKWRQKNKKKLG